MKKILSGFICLIILLTLCSCREKRSDVKPITKGITFTAGLTYYNECYECFVTVNKTGEMSVKLLSPDTIKGLSFYFSDDNVTVKYNGLEYKYNITSMPEGIVCSSLYEILKDTWRDDTAVILDKDKYFIQGNTGKNKYKMFLGETGLPISVTDEQTGLSVDFKNVTLV